MREEPRRTEKSMDLSSKAYFTFSKTLGSFWASSMTASPTSSAQRRVRREASACRSSTASRFR